MVRNPKGGSDLSKKCILAMALFCFLGALGAASYQGFAWNGLEPSSVNMALGGSPVGVVNHWHKDPLCAYGNPAFASLGEGIAYSHTSYLYMHKSDILKTENLEYRAALLGVSYHGFALLLPALGNSNSAGVELGEFAVSDSTGELVDNFSLNEDSSTLGFSVNLPAALALMAPGVFPKYVRHLALGANWVSNASDSRPDPDNEGVLFSLKKAESVNLGLSACLGSTLQSGFDLEYSFGAAYINAFDGKAEYSGQASGDPIYKRLSVGGAISLSAENPHYSQGYGLASAVRNLCSGRVLLGAAEEFSDDAPLLGFGCEAGVFDTIFLRAGYHHDKAGNISGQTYGWGVNLHYRDLFSARLNHALFPRGRLRNQKSAYDYGVSANILGLYQLLSK